MENKNECELSAMEKLSISFRKEMDRADKWRAVADKLYNSWVYLTDDTLREAIKEYKQLIEEDNGSRD